MNAMQNMKLPVTDRHVAWEYELRQLRHVSTQLADGSADLERIERRIDAVKDRIEDTIATSPAGVGVQFRRLLEIVSDFEISPSHPLCRNIATALTSLDLGVALETVEKPGTYPEVG